MDDLMGATVKIKGYQYYKGFQFKKREEEEEETSNKNSLDL